MLSLIHSNSTTIIITMHAQYSAYCGVHRYENKPQCLFTIINYVQHSYTQWTVLYRSWLTELGVFYKIDYIMKQMRTK